MNSLIDSNGRLVKDFDWKNLKVIEEQIAYLEMKKAEYYSLVQSPPSDCPFCKGEPAAKEALQLLDNEMYREQNEHTTKCFIEAIEQYKHKVEYCIYKSTQQKLDNVNKYIEFLDLVLFIAKDSKYLGMAEYFYLRFNLLAMEYVNDLFSEILKDGSGMSPCPTELFPKGAVYPDWDFNEASRSVLKVCNTDLINDPYSWKIWSMKKETIEFIKNKYNLTLDEKGKIVRADAEGKEE